METHLHTGGICLLREVAAAWGPSRGGTHSRASRGACGGQKPLRDHLREPGKASCSLPFHGADFASGNPGKRLLLPLGRMSVWRTGVRPGLAHWLPGSVQPPCLVQESDLASPTGSPDQCSPPAWSRSRAHPLTALTIAGPVPQTMLSICF